MPKTLVLFLLTGLFTSSLPASPDATSLLQQLQKTFVTTTMDATGIKVAKPGATLAVQIDGVTANPKGKVGSFKNIFADGQIRPDNCLKCQLTNRLGTQRAFQVGEKVYLLNMELKDRDSITLEVQSCGTCDPKALDPSHHPFQAQVTFKFLKGALGVTDANQVQQVIEQVFKVAGADAPATDNTQQQAPAPPAQGMPAQGGYQAPPAQAAEPPAQQKFSDIPPPPPPPDTPAPAAATRKIEIGQTIDQVQAMFSGINPTIAPGPAGAEIRLYKDRGTTFKITFKNGKVADVDVL